MMSGRVLELFGSVVLGGKKWKSELGSFHGLGCHPSGEIQRLMDLQ